MLPTISEEIENDPMPLPYYPFGEGLDKNKTRRRPKSDYVYEALYYIGLFALVFVVIYNDMYVYHPKISNHPKSTNHTNSTNLKNDEVSSTLLRWIPKLLASLLIGQVVAWAMVYVSCRLLSKFPSLSLALDTATLVSFLLGTKTSVDLVAYPAILLLAILPVVASFLLPAMKRVVAHLRVTLSVMADLPVHVLGICKNWDYIAFGAHYWSWPRQRITRRLIFSYVREVALLNRGAMMVPRFVVALGESIFRAESGRRWRRFRGLMRDEPYIISCVQAYDIKTSAEIFEASQDRRKNTFQPSHWERYIIRAIAWTTYLRLTILLGFFIDHIIHLLNYDGFFDHYEAAMPFIMGLSMVPFWSRTTAIMRGSMTNIECDRQNIELYNRHISKN